MQNTSDQATDISLFNSYCHIKIIVVPQLSRLKKSYLYCDTICLINFYAPQARTSMNRDKDEMELNAPVISISLGDSCLFRIGTTEKQGKTHSIRLNSGDVICLVARQVLLTTALIEFIPIHLHY